eukprot:756959-Pleurochrysis_carterae.AAC.1
MDLSVSRRRAPLSPHLRTRLTMPTFATSCSGSSAIFSTRTPPSTTPRSFRTRSSSTRTSSKTRRRNHCHQHRTLAHASPAASNASQHLSSTCAGKILRSVALPLPLSLR